MTAPLVRQSAFQQVSGSLPERPSDSPGLDLLASVIAENPSLRSPQDLEETSKRKRDERPCITVNGKPLGRGSNLFTVTDTGLTPVARRVRSAVEWPKPLGRVEGAEPASNSRCATVEGNKLYKVTSRGFSLVSDKSVRKRAKIEPKRVSLASVGRMAWPLILQRKGPLYQRLVREQRLTNPDS